MSSQNSSSTSPSHYSRRDIDRMSNSGNASAYSTPSPTSSGSSCSATYPMNSLSLSHSQRPPSQAASATSSASHYAHHAGDIPDNKRQKRTQPAAAPSPASSSSSYYPAQRGPGGPHSMTPAPPNSSQTGFRHPPTELPPRPYTKGDPLPGTQRPRPNRIPESAMGYLPILENRFNALEVAVGEYAERRGKDALNRSILPGLDQEGSPSKYRASGSGSGSSKS